MCQNNLNIFNELGKLNRTIKYKSMCSNELLNNFLLDIDGCKLRHLGREYDLNGLAIVISPHPDDESIAMGGTIAKLLDHGFISYTIYVTCERLHFFRKSNAKKRKYEALNALKELGLKNENIFYLDLPDGDVKKEVLSFSKSAGRLRDVITHIKHNNSNGNVLILTTSRYDAHRDHEEVYNMIKNGLRKYFILEFPTINHMYSSYEYNCIIDISNYYNKKHKALLQYSGEIKKGRILWEEINNLENETGNLIQVHKAESCFISWYGYIPTN